MKIKLNFSKAITVSNIVVDFILAESRQHLLHLIVSGIEEVIFFDKLDAD